MTYAVARYSSEPLLAVGDNFEHTELQFAPHSVVGRWEGQS
jgi:uncharacterized protein with PIN domain